MAMRLTAPKTIEQTMKGMKPLLLALTVLTLGQQEYASIIATLLLHLSAFAALAVRRAWGR